MTVGCLQGIEAFVSSVPVVLAEALIKLIIQVHSDADIEQLRTDAQFIQVSAASVRESHPHDIAITQEAPNYSSESSGESA